jgi:toxin ParE1/3/4
VTVQVAVSRAASRDIDTILGYLTREAGPAVASKYRRSLLRLFVLVSDQPALGVRRPKLGRGVRMCVVAPYLVLYRTVGDDLVNILRVLHGRRRLTAALLRRTE